MSWDLRESGPADAGHTVLLLPGARLCEAGGPAWVVHGERGDGGITDEERRTLEACPRMSVITIPGAGYFTPNEEAALVARLVVEALSESADHEEQQTEHRCS